MRLGHSSEVWQTSWFHLLLGKGAYQLHHYQAKDDSVQSIHPPTHSSVRNAIIFGCLGFATNQAFIIKDGRQLMVGIVANMLGDGHFKFWPYDFFKDHYIARKGEEYGLTEADIPNPDDVIAEYKRQYAEQGVVINNEIEYAG